MYKPKKVKTCLKISYIGIKTIFTYFYISFLQYVNSTVKQIGKNTYEITYIINGNTYKMIVSPLKGPSPVLQIIDHNLNDVTDEILPYLGPERNWHGKPISLDFFNKESLTFEMADGTSKIFTLDKHLHIE
jgi:hypothetical protein